MTRFATLLVACLLFAGPAHAGPVAAAISMIGTWIGNVLAAGGFGAFLLRTGASIALSMLAMALGKRKFSPTGIRTETTTSGGTTPQKFLLGLTATGGQLIAPPMSHGSGGGMSNVHLNYIIALSVVPGCTLQRVIIDDKWVPLGAESPSGWGRAATGHYAGKAWIDYQDGRQTTAHAGFFSIYANDPDRPWSADMVGPGTCYATTYFVYSREYFNGLPQLRFEMMGIPVYDPRADSTVGGSGPQRWSNPATWTQSANPALLIYNIMRGIDVGAGLRWGGECEPEDLPPDNWFAAMNACDLAIPDGAGGTVPQYRGGIEVALDDEPAAIIEELLKAACAQMSEIGGIWKIRVGGPGLPSYFLTDDAVLVSDESQYDPFPSLADTWNGISCTYPDPESRWESKEAPPRYNAAWEAEDGGRRLVADLRLPACPYPEQVQRVMAASIADHRRMRQHRIGIGPEAAVLEPLDSIGWTSTRYGYTAKVFEVARVTDILMNLNQGLHLRERDAGDFDWSPSRLIPWSPPAIITTPPPPQTVPGLAAVASVITDAGSTARRPAITLTWNAAGVSDARGILWEARLASETAASLSGSYNNVSSGALRLVAGLLPATAYRVRARPILDRATVWSGWIAVVTPDVRIGNADLTTDVVAAMEDTLEASGLAAAARDAAALHESAAILARNAAQASQAGALSSEIAARSSETAAAGSAGSAAASGALATTGATEAGGYAAQALDYRNTAARLTGGGVSKNPVFALWSGSAPQEMQVVLGTGNAISRITSGIRYSSALQAYCGGTTDGPMVRLNRSINTLDCAVSPAGILIRAEIEYIGGNLANSGACLRALWIDTATRAEVRMLKDYIVASTGQVQVVEIYIPRPAAAVPGSATNFALDFFAGSTLGGAPRASATFRLHRLDFEEVLANSQTSIYQRAVADLAGIQSAVIGLRAVAGSGGAVLELVATSGPTGSASLARISADNILLQGTVTADYLNVNWLVGGRISASYLDVDSLLTILPGAGLSYGKSSVASDETDGIYFGHDGGRFGLAASRTNAGKRQSLKLASSTGLQILNARHFVSGDAVPSQTIYTASTAGIINVPAGTSRMSFDLVGGGGGGGSRQVSGGQSTWGYPGGATTLYVYDGATLRHSFVSAGGQEGRGLNSNGGTVSTHGAAWGSGGKGGLSGIGGVPSQGGWAAAAVVTDWIDLSGYASPRIRVVVGAGGLPGAGGAGWNSGDPGTPGRVVMSDSAARDVKADVLPLEPTAPGSFVTAGSGSFPNLGAGLWILHRNTGTTGLGLGYVTLSPGTVVRAYQDGSSTLISSQTPTYTGGDAGLTVFYAFYAMGSWG